MTCSCLFTGGCQRLVRRALNPRGRIVATVVLAIAMLVVGAVAASAQFPSDPDFESVPTQTDLNPPPPPPPLLVTPADGAGCLEGASICLDWADEAFAVSYEVQIGTSCGIGPIYTALDSTLCPPGLLPGTLYYWRVRAKDGFEQWGEWSPCWALTTLPDLPPPPVHLTPIDGALCQLLTVCFDWDDLTGAVAYEIRIGTTCGTGDVYATATSEYCPPDFDLGTTYHWQVRGRDACDQWSNWSDCWSFTTVAEPLAAPTLLLPLDGVDCQPLDVCLNWDDVPGAAGYEVQVGTSCGIGDHYTSVGSELCDPLLAVDTFYHWRVRTKDACDQWGPWSECLTFRTAPSPPGFALLLDPPDTDTCVATTACVDWDDVSTAAAYEVQIGPSCGDGPSYGTTDSDFCPPGLAGGTTYFWRVRAQEGECGVWGTWTDCFSFTTSPNLDPPTLVEPLDEADCVAIRPCVDWTGVVGAVGYQVHLGSDCDTGTTYDTVNSEYCPDFDLAYETVYYWKVRVQDDCGGWSDWSECWWFETVPEPLAAPTLLTPTNAAECVPVADCLDWDNVTGAVAYQVHLGSACDVGTVYDTVDSEYCPASHLAFETVYFWRVRAQDRCGQWSDWSVCWGFETAPEVLGAPTLLTPVDVADCVPVADCLDWDSVTGATGYQVHLGSDCDTGTTHDVVDSEYCPASDLAFETVYYWKVRTQDRCGQWSDWSECWSFETAPEPLDAPPLLTPVDVADCVPVADCLDWDSVTGATGYQVHLGSDCDTGTTHDVVDSEYCPASDLPLGTVYYWKVRVQDRCGQWSDWSECWWFETEPAELDIPTLLAPADNDECVPVADCFDWDDVTDAVEYEIQIGPDCNTGATYLVLDSEYCPVPDLGFGTVYYWKVRAKDACDRWTDWSECWAFETAPEVLVTPTLLTPANGGPDKQDLDVCMDWDNVPGAVGYEIQLDLICGSGPIYATVTSDFCPPAELICETEYFWSVRAQDRCDQWSDWTEPCWTFTTKKCCIPPDWSVHPPDFLYTGTITAEVLLEDLPVAGPDDLLAAFFEGECRGVSPTWQAPGGEYLFLLTVYSNAASGEFLTFKYFNEEDCEVHLVCDEIEFTPSMEHGTIPVPYPMDITDVCVEREFVTGWNWFSLNVHDEDMSLNTVLASLGANGFYIKDQFDFAQYDIGFGGWFGTLDEITCTSSYLIQMTAPDILEFCGCPCDPETVIPLVEVWNWPGYIPQVPMPTDLALTSLDDNGIIIKNQTTYAEYVPPWGWIGTLTTMVPLDGFKIDMENPDDLIYPPPPAARTAPEDVAASGALLDAEARVDGWTVDPGEFSSNGTVTASVMAEGEPVVSSGDILGAFVGRACRGVTEAAVLPNGDFVFFLVVHGEGEETIEFRFFDASEGDVLDVEEAVTFEPDMIRGRVVAPYPMTVGATGAGSDDLVPSVTALYGNHPNPFRGGTVVRYSLKEAGHVAIEVYNLKGERVRTLVDARREPGAYLVDWDGRDGSGATVSSGVYFCRMVTEGYTTTSQMVLIK